jgi:TonB family protein
VIEKPEPAPAPPPAPPIVPKEEPEPPRRPPIPPAPPPERRGKGALIAALAVIVIAAAAIGYLLATGKLGGKGAGPSEDELLAAQATADSLARAAYDTALQDAEQAIEAAETTGAQDDAPELLALAMAARDSAARLESGGDLVAARQLLLASGQRAREARTAAMETQRVRREEQTRRDEELRGVLELVSAAQDSLAVVEELGGRRYAARSLARLDSVIQTAGAAVDAGDAARGRRALSRLAVLITAARDEIETARAEEEEVRQRLEEQRRQQAEEQRRQEEEAQRAPIESTPPQIVELAAPVYPPLARAAGVQGTVTLDFLVDVDGSVKDITVIDGPTALGEAARDALERSTIRPATQGGQPVTARMQKRFTFRL